MAASMAEISWMMITYPDLFTKRKMKQYSQRNAGPHRSAHVPFKSCESINGDTTVVCDAWKM